MTTYDENGNVIENEAQNMEMFIEADDSFAEHEYDLDNIIIEEDNTNDNEQVMDFTQFDDNHTTYDDYDDTSNEISSEVLEADKIAEQAKQNFETEFSDINDMIQQTQDSNIKEHDENTQDIATTTTIQPTATKEQEHEENKENHNNNNLDFLNKKVEKIENINDRDNLAYKTKEQFETEFSDINEILSLSNQLDNTLDNNMDNNPNNNKAETRDTQDLDKKPINLEKEKENLDRALDNLIKVRSFADLIRALYMLDEALFAIKDKRDRPEKNKTIQLLKKGAKKGWQLTKEYAVIAIKEIAVKKKELDDYINTRKKEVEMQRNLSSQTKAYKLAISPKQKENHAIQMQKNMEYVNKELPDFRKNYPKTYERATETLKSYEKTKSKEKDVRKGRTL